MAIKLGLPIQIPFFYDELKFRAFQCSRSSVHTYIRLVIVCTLFVMQDIYTSYMVPFTHTRLLLYSLLACLLFVGWTLCSIKYYIESDGNNSFEMVGNKILQSSIFSTNRLQLFVLSMNRRVFGTNRNNLVRIMHIFEDSFVDVISITAGIMVIYQSTFCTGEKNMNQSQFCSNESTNLPFLLPIATWIPSDLTAITLIVPLFNKVLLKGASWFAILRSMTIVISLIIYSIIVTKSWQSLYLLVIFVPFISMMLLELRRQNVEVFILNETLHQSLEDNEKLAEEMRLNEMKMMIGNIAHDLKTPLTAFLSGLDEINTINASLKVKYQLFFSKLKKSQKHIFNADSIIGDSNNDFFKTTAPISSRGKANQDFIFPKPRNEELLSLQNSLTDDFKKTVFEMVDNIQECVETSKSINSFMLMSINRCIDFTKVRHNVTLKAKMETFYLQEVLDGPFNCMKNMQSLIEIKLYPIPPVLCTHIITDKQWFQENLLCLITNAVKYSSKGVVTIKIFLWDPTEVILAAAAAAATLLEENETGVVPKSGNKVVTIATIDKRINESKENGSDSFSNYNSPVRISGNRDGAYNMDFNNDSEMLLADKSTSDNNLLTATPAVTYESSANSTRLPTLPELEPMESTMIDDETTLMMLGGAGSPGCYNNSNFNNNTNNIAVSVLLSEKSQFSQNSLNTSNTTSTTTTNQNIKTSSNNSSSKSLLPSTSLGNVDSDTSTDNLNELSQTPPQMEQPTQQRIDTSSSMSLSSPSSQPPSSIPGSTSSSGRVSGRGSSSPMTTNHSGSSSSGGYVGIRRTRNQILLTKNKVAYTSFLPKDTTKELLHVRIEVEDQGIGIPDETRKNLFAPFKQAQRLAGGTGLGLFSLAKRLESMNGLYGAEPRSDGQQGSLFWFSFPYQPDKPTAKVYKIEEELMRNGTDSTTTLAVDAGHVAVSAGNSFSGTGLKRVSVVPIPDPSPRTGTIAGTVLAPLVSLLAPVLSPVLLPAVLTGTGGSYNLQYGYFTDLLSTRDSNNISNTSATNTNATAESKYQHYTRDTTVNIAKVSVKLNGGADVSPTLIAALNSFSDDEDEDSDDEDELKAIVMPVYNILVVDDSLPIRKVLTSMLKGQGHTVVTAVNGAESLDRLAEQHAAHNGLPFDVILMDMQMPVMDGLEATRRIRSDEAKRLVKVKDNDTRTRRHSLMSSTDSSYSKGTSSGFSSSRYVRSRNLQPSDDRTSSSTPNSSSTCHSSDRTGSGNIVVSNHNGSLNGFDPNENISGGEDEVTMAVPVVDYYQNILALSANSDDDTIASAFEVGVDEFMPKPFTIKSLYEKLQVIRNKRLL